MRNETPSLENLRAVLRAYAVIIFSGDLRVGALLCVASLMEPWVGLSGLAGTFVALAAARIVGFERAAIDDGRLLFNSLLCSLAVGAWVPPGTVNPLLFAALLGVTSLAALGCTVMLNQATLVLVGVASRSLSYCVVGIGLNWLLTRLVPAPELIPANWSFSPPALEYWTRAMATLFFGSSAWAGVLVAVALLLASRLSFLHAVLGFAVSGALLKVLGFPLAQSYWLQLDAILCAIALGGVFYVPSRSALLLAGFGAALCTIIGVALLQGFWWINAPILTLPFNLVVLGVAGALRWRAPGHEPRAVLFPRATPEATFWADQLARARDAEPHLPAIAPPFDGAWLVTQGFEGKHTHRGAWRHALDFELAAGDAPAKRAASTLDGEFPSFNAPIVAPADGRVVRVVDDVVDNTIGGNNFSENWGNSVVIEIGAQLYVQLSHFRHRGMRVREGDRVRQGQLLGYLGNSGRSPVPHLHLQMQVQPDVGAPTVPFRLRSYRTPAREGNWQFHFLGQPAEGAVVAGCRRTPLLEELFAEGPEFERPYRVFTAHGEESETIRFSRTADGSLLLESREKNTKTRLAVYPGHLSPVEFRGSPRSLLAVFAAGGRLPLSNTTYLQWEDLADPAFVDGRRGRILREMVAPFLNRPPQTCVGELEPQDGQNQFVVRWKCPRQWNAELHFGAQGLLSGRLETKAHWLRFLSYPTPEATPAAPTPERQPVEEFALL